MQKFSRKTNFGMREPGQNLTKEKRNNYLKRKMRSSNMNAHNKSQKMEDDKNSPKFQSFAKNIGKFIKFSKFI